MLSTLKDLGVLTCRTPATLRTMLTRCLLDGREGVGMVICCNSAVMILIMGAVERSNGSTQLTFHLKTYLCIAFSFLHVRPVI